MDLGARGHSGIKPGTKREETGCLKEFVESQAGETNAHSRDFVLGLFRRGMPE